jgi:pSer/pThr/pTyr-binding forkhead associated (FHA) protein/NADPH-dependent 2,4-dienoyl-CoA reductase/sulfur reductase-like enzyme
LGDGVAGMSAAEVIRTQNPADRVAVLSCDPQPYYYRAALTNYLMGGLSDAELWALPPDAWSRLQIERIYGAAAALHADEKTVTLGDGRSLKYDRLLIATGTRARTLATPEQDPARGVVGANLPGITAVRTLADTRKIIEAIPQTRAAIVLGGGILGIEAAQGLTARNVQVTLVHRGSWLLERVVTRRAGELIQHRMTRDGVHVCLDANIQRIVGNSTAIRSVVLDDGREIPGSLVVICIGTIPNTEWLKGSAVRLESGFIPVDDQMRVRGLTDVWSAGDVAVFRDESLPFANPGGLWQPAQKQGQVAGLCMSTRGSFSPAVYRPGAIYNATRAWDLDLVTLGDHVDAQGTKLTRGGRQDGKPVYKTILVRDNHVAGVLLLGDRREGHALRHLMNLKGPEGDVSGIAERILDPEFDLPAWVASRVQQPGAARWKETVVLPTGPLPPSLAAASGKLTQLQVAIPLAAVPTVADSADVIPITLQLGASERVFRQRRVRIGRDSKCDVVCRTAGAGPEEIVLSLEGSVWVAASNQKRHQEARLNGRVLSRPAVLRNGDLLAIGGCKAIVCLSARQRACDVGSDLAWLVGARRFGLTDGVTSLGASADNDVTLTGPGVSLFHCQVHRRASPGAPADYFLVDAGSQNGTFVNEQPVFSPVRLGAGDVVRIGSIPLVFERAATPSGSPAPATRPDAQQAVAGGLRRVYLVATQGPWLRRVVAIGVPGTLGRDPKADARIDDPLVSRVHARFDHDDRGFTITDLGSINGISLDGRRLSAAEPTPVADGAQLRIGRNLYRLCHEAPSELHSLPAPSAQELPHRRFDQTILVPRDGARFEVTAGTDRSEHRLHGSRVSIGRANDNDLVLFDPNVSRQHLELTAHGETWLLKGVGKSATSVNGRELVPQQQVTLCDGDVVQLGLCKLVYRASSTTHAPAISGTSPPIAEPAINDVPVARLIAELPGSAIQEFTLAGPGPFTLGREQGCSAVFPFPVVSRRHAEIRFEEPHYSIRDLGSSLGTQINGAPLTGTAAATLAHGDVIALGSLALRFTCASHGQEAADQPPPSPAVEASVADACGSEPPAGFRVDWTAAGDGGVPSHVRGRRLSPGTGPALSGGSPPRVRKRRDSAADRAANQ